MSTYGPLQLALKLHLKGNMVGPIRADLFWKIARIKTILAFSSALLMIFVMIFASEQILASALETDSTRQTSEEIPPYLKEWQRESDEVISRFRERFHLLGLYAADLIHELANRRVSNTEVASLETQIASVTAQYQKLVDELNAKIKILLEAKAGTWREERKKPEGSNQDVQVDESNEDWLGKYNRTFKNRHSLPYDPFALDAVHSTFRETNAHPSILAAAVYSTILGAIMAPAMAVITTIAYGVINGALNLETFRLFYMTSPVFDTWPARLGWSFVGLTSVGSSAIFFWRVFHTLKKEAHWINFLNHHLNQLTTSERGLWHKLSERGIGIPNLSWDITKKKIWLEALLKGTIESKDLPILVGGTKLDQDSVPLILSKTSQALQSLKDNNEQDQADRSYANDLLNRLQHMQTSTDRSSDAVAQFMNQASTFAKHLGENGGTLTQALSLAPDDIGLFIQPKVKSTNAHYLIEGEMGLWVVKEILPLLKSSDLDSSVREEIESVNGRATKDFKQIPIIFSYEVKIQPTTDAKGIVELKIHYGDLILRARLRTSETPTPENLRRILDPKELVQAFKVDTSDHCRAQISQLGGDAKASDGKPQ